MATLPRDVVKSINSQLPREVGKKFELIVQNRFNIIKNKMILDFESHPVTEEIEAGVNTSNTSGTLGGYGNLFSFIGFPSGYDPLSKVKARLYATTLRKIKFDKRGRLEFITTEPTREELFAITKFSDFREDFEGSRSWLDGIETGISGLGFYLYEASRDIAKSRSGKAIQLKGGKKSGKAFGGSTTGGATSLQRSRYTRVSYMSGILREFRMSIKKLQSQKIA
jgi:hypothetical protein